MDLTQLLTYLNSYLNISEFSDYGPNGLQVEGKREIKKMASAVTANLETIERACADGVDALLVHHGLFWERDPYVIEGTKRKKLQLLLEKGISLLAYHLPLDAHPEVGNNWSAARDLGWRDMRAFEIGVKGCFEPVEFETFVDQLEKYYGHHAVRAEGGKKIVSSAALISGGAYKYLAQAAKEGVDCFITGNYDEPAWSMALEEGVNFLSLGHCATEKIGPRKLAHHIGEHFGVPCDFIDSKNPF